jgi:hypothetical protein
VIVLLHCEGRCGCNFVIVHGISGVRSRTNRNKKLKTSLETPLIHHKRYLTGTNWCRSTGNGKLNYKQCVYFN